jgi:hypothetical protein
VWFATRAERDASVTNLEKRAAHAGLLDPHFARIKRRIRTKAAHAWLADLQAHGTIHGHDAPTHEWHE